MDWLKRALVHFSLLIGVASIVIEHDHIFSRWSSTDTEVQTITSSDKLLSKAIQEGLKERAKDASPQALVSVPEEIASFQDLKKIKFKDSRLKLLSVFGDEKLDGQSVFRELSTYGSVAGLFRDEVMGFERGTLRSSLFKDQSGFDQIYYKIYYSSGKMAHVFVRTNGGLELAIYAPDGPGFQSQTFKDGLWLKDEKISEADIDGKIQAHLKGSASVLQTTVGAF